MLEVIVVGGGIAGAAVALELAHQAAVNVIDQARPGGSATGASGGMLAPQYESGGDSPYFRLLVEARDAYLQFAARLEELSGQSLHVRYDGMLVANFSDAERAGAEEAAAWQRAAGLRAEIIPGPDARRLEPGLDPDIPSFLWLPAEGRADSQALARALPDALAGAGVRSIAGKRVVEVLARGGRVRGVRLEGGRELEGDVVVLAAGAWSGTIEDLPRPIPVRPVRGHMLRFPAGAARLQRQVATHAGRYLVPRSDGSMLAGSTMDDVGFDRSLSEEGLQTVQEGVARLLPALATARAQERWADLRPISADGLPILGPEPELEGLFYATGYGRNGILFGPLAGRMVAGLILGEDVRGWEPFSAARLPLATGGPERGAP